MNLTGVTYKYLYREDIEQIKVFNINQGKVKICRVVEFANHHSTVCFCTSIIGNIVTGWLVKPRGFDLNLCQSSVDIKHQIIGKSIPYWLQYSPFAFQRLEDCRLFRDVTLQLGIHFVNFAVKPDELPLLYPAMYL